MLGVEGDRHACLVGAAQHRLEARARSRDAFLRGERAEERRQRRGLHRDVGARQGAPRVLLEVRPSRPGRARRHQRVEQLGDALRVAIGLGVGERVLAEQVDGARLPLAPEPGEAGERRGRRLTRDELAGHAADVAPDHRGRDLGAEGEVLREVDAQVEGAWHRDALEVLVDVAQHVGIVRARREHVDEPEQLGLEVGVGERPVEHALAPPAEAEHVRVLATAGLGDAARQRLHRHLVDEVSRHHASTTILVDP